MTLGEVSKNDSPAFMLQRFSGVTKIGIGIKDTNGRKSVNTINIPISDHVSQEEILESAWEIRTTYFPEVSQIDLMHIVSLMQPTGASYFNQKEVQLFLSLIDPIIELD
ncbi:hypothetical protein D3C71_1751610 [compost metagenome]